MIYFNTVKYFCLLVPLSSLSVPTAKNSFFCIFLFTGNLHLQYCCYAWVFFLSKTVLPKTIRLRNFLFRILWFVTLSKLKEVESGNLKLPNFCTPGRILLGAHWIIWGYIGGGGRHNTPSPGGLRERCPPPCGKNPVFCNRTEWQHTHRT